jgi:hypothetical protein
MNVVRYGFVAGGTLFVIFSLLLDPATYRPGGLRQSLHRVRRSPLFDPSVGRSSRTTNGPTFTLTTATPPNWWKPGLHDASGRTEP